MQNILFASTDDRRHKEYVSIIRFTNIGIIKTRENITTKINKT